MRIIFGENFDSQKFIIGKPSSDGEYLCGPRSLVDVISLFIGTKAVKPLLNSTRALCQTPKKNSRKKKIAC